MAPKKEGRRGAGMPRATVPAYNPLGLYPLWTPPKPAEQFGRPASASLTIESLDDRRWPSVRLSPQAHGKMWALIQTCNIEVGWLSTCYKLGDGFVIDDVFVPQQRCTAATTVITREGEAELLDTLMSERKYDTINSLGCWGHSHVNFDVFASGQDEAQTQEYLEKRRGQKHNHFIRVIANKRGDFFCSLYLLDSELVLHNPLLEVAKPDAEVYVAWAQEQIDRKVRREIITTVTLGAIGSELGGLDLHTLDDWLDSGLLDMAAYKRLKPKAFVSVNPLGSSEPPMGGIEDFGDINRGDVQ